MSKIRPRPLRVPPDMLARVDAQAKAEGKSQHAMLVLLIGRGLGDTPSEQPTIGTGLGERVKAQKAKRVLAAAEKQAQHLAVPKPLDASMVPFNPERAPMQKRKSRWRV